MTALLAEVDLMAGPLLSPGQKLGLLAAGCVLFALLAVAARREPRR